MESMARLRRRRPGGADDPSTVAVLKPDPGTVCLVCHRKNVAKPRGFPQVVPEEHSQGAPCNDCHTAHHPDLG